jgi:hypothetical protein
MGIIDINCLYLYQNVTRHWEIANGYWYYMKEIYGWDLLKNLYQPVRNEIMSEFRQLCEKE